MSRKGNPEDNAACESFIQTLKYEEVLRNEYRDLAEARASIGEFLGVLLGASLRRTAAFRWSAQSIRTRARPRLRPAHRPR